MEGTDPYHNHDQQHDGPDTAPPCGEGTYAYRRFGSGPGQPLLFRQRFTGTLDNWDWAVTDPLSAGRDGILFDNAGIGR